MYDLSDNGRCAVISGRNRITSTRFFPGAHTYIGAGLMQYSHRGGDLCRRRFSWVMPTGNRSNPTRILSLSGRWCHTGSYLMGIRRNILSSMVTVVNLPLEYSLGFQITPGTPTTAGPSRQDTAPTCVTKINPAPKTMSFYM
jgi:hypothetical protein